MITLRQIKEIIELKPEDFETKTEYYIQLVSCFYDLDPDSNELQNMPASELKRRFDFINKWYIGINKKTAESFEVDGVEFTKKPCNKLTLGEYIDAEHYLFNEQLNLIAILYRILIKGKDFEEDKWEDYGNFIDKRMSVFLDKVDAEKTLGVINEFKEFRNNLIESNQGKFAFEPEEDEEEAMRLMTAAERREYKRELQKEKQKQQFGWERLIMDLCGEDITKMKDVLSLPVIMVFNVINMLSIKR